MVCASAAIAAESVLATRILSFGYLAPPTSGSQTFELDPISGAVTAGAGDGCHFGGAQAGEYLVTGTPFANISVSVSIGHFPSAGVSESVVIGTSGSDTIETSLDAQGEATVQVGGTLTVSPGAGAGQLETALTVVVLFN
jgi:hypothetical protein